MLQQFTWQQFLIAAIVLTLLWYAGVILLFYRTGFFGLFGGKGSSGGNGGENGSGGGSRRFGGGSSTGNQLGKGSEGPDDYSEEEAGLMGESKLPQGMSMLTSDAFGFSGGDAADGKMEQLGLVPDVIQEVKAVFAKLSENDGSKRDFLEMMRKVRDMFPGVGASPSIGRINGFIAGHAPFHLSAEELDDLWV